MSTTTTDNTTDVQTSSTNSGDDAEAEVAAAAEDKASNLEGGLEKEKKISASKEAGDGEGSSRITAEDKGKENDEVEWPGSHEMGDVTSSMEEWGSLPKAPVIKGVTIQRGIM